MPPRLHKLGQLRHRQKVRSRSEMSSEMSWKQWIIFRLQKACLWRQRQNMNFMLKRTSNKMEDTVTLARQEREKQGPWEAEVSYGGEADLHRHLASCDKHPGHQKFIPVYKFNVGHLPPGYQDNELVDLVRALSDLTVRVSVKYVSDSRPEVIPGSDEPFPCYKDRGRDMMRTGTGWVWRVNKNPVKYKHYTTCKCKECLNSPTLKSSKRKVCLNSPTLKSSKRNVCLNSPTPNSSKCEESVNASTPTCSKCEQCLNSSTPTSSKCKESVNSPASKICKCKECVNSPAPESQFSQIHIITASHVVFDDLEAAHTTCHLFFDKGMSPEVCSGVVTLSGMSAVWSKLDMDWCAMSYASHDLDLTDRLDKMVSNLLSLGGIIEEKYDYLISERQKSQLVEQPVPHSGDTITIIVSHPHACSKQVSIGHFTHREKRKDGYSKFVYTTPTCPGSSGARVFVVGRKWYNLYDSRVHSKGTRMGGQELNFSGYGYYLM